MVGSRNQTSRDGMPETRRATPTPNRMPVSTRTSSKDKQLKNRTPGRNRQQCTPPSGTVPAMAYLLVHKAVEEHLVHELPVLGQQEPRRHLQHSTETAGGWRGKTGGARDKLKTVMATTQKHTHTGFQQQHQEGQRAAIDAESERERDPVPSSKIA